jgi:hypothetical protein
MSEEITRRAIDMIDFGHEMTFMLCTSYFSLKWCEFEYDSELDIYEFRQYNLQSQHSQGVFDNTLFVKFNCI